jgi:hypothetical protein
MTTERKNADGTPMDAAQIAEAERIEKLEAEQKAAEKAEAERLAKLTPEQREEERINKLAEAKAAANLKTIKENLDKAYAARDAAIAAKEALEKKERDAELKRLEEEGKHKEAYDLKIAERDKENERLRKQNIELSRDVAVREALKEYNFRNATASEMAYKEIVAQLVQDSNGQWVHKSGASIKDFAKTFSTSEEQSFLFAPKASSGGGSGDSSSGGNHQPDLNAGKSLFSLPQAEVLKRAAEGKLGKRQQRY